MSDLEVFVAQPTASQNYQTCCRNSRHWLPSPIIAGGECLISGLPTGWHSGLARAAKNSCWRQQQQQQHRGFSVAEHSTPSLLF